MQHNKLNNWLILVLLAIIWGSSYILIKIGLVSFTPMQVGFMRIGLSGIAMLPFLKRYIQGTTKSIWGWCLLLGLVGNIIPFVCFALAQSVINSSLAGMLNSLQPLFTLVIGLFIFKQAMPRRQMIGVLIGFAGATILLGAHSSVASFTDNFIYSLLVVLATFCYGLAANIIRQYLHDVSPLKITTLSLCLLIVPSTIILAYSDILIRFQYQQEVMSSLYAIAFLGIFGTAIAVILYNKLIKDAGMMMASSVAYLIPVVAIFWGAIDGELINTTHLIGISVIFTGLYLINQHKSSKTVTVD